MFITLCKTRKEELLHSLALALTLSLALTLVFNHLANKLLQATTNVHALWTNIFNLLQHDGT